MSTKLDRSHRSSTGADFRPVILAGGSGTRFWPRSRRARAKQVLPLNSDRSMLQETVARFRTLGGTEKVWIVTNDLLAPTIAEQLPDLPAAQLLREPAARNTAPAAGLAAFLVERSSPDAVIGIFPADHVIGNEPEFLSVLQEAIALAAEPGVIVVLGVKPTRPETGYGYIEAASPLRPGVLLVQRFTEKPDLPHAEQFLRAGTYYWNSGIFLWSARTLADALREYLPTTAGHLAKIAEAYGTPEFEQCFAGLYPLCDNISIDYAVLEPRSQKGEGASKLYCLPVDFGWNDLGSWAALYEHRLLAHQDSDDDGNVGDHRGALTLEARGNYVYSPGKFVALVGVENLVVVDTGDALLITTRDRSQDVGKVVKQLAASGRDDLV